MRKSIFLLFLLILSFNVSAVLDSDYDYYMSVNQTYEVVISDTFNGSEKVFLVINNNVLNLTYDNVSKSYNFFTSNDVEEDVSFEIVSADTSFQTHSGSDNVGRDGEIRIDNQVGNEDLMFLFSYLYNITVNQTESHTSTVCANLRKETPINRNVRFVTGIYNGSNYEYYESQNHLIDNSVSEIHCENIDIEPHKHEENLNITSGFYCLDCDASGIYLAYDTNSSFLGRSSTYNINTNEFVQNNTLNYEIAMILFSEIYGSTLLDEILRFRIPYNVSISLYQENVSGLGTTAQYCNEFSNIFMTDKEDKTVFTDIDNWYVYANKFMNAIPYFGQYSAEFLEEEFNTEGVLFYNGAYQNCQGTITLYEPGNYSLFLVGSKYVISGKDYGFNSPIDGKEQFISNIIDNIEFTEKENVDIAIFTSDWEISKVWVLLNIGKWLLFTIVPIVLIWLIKSGVLGALVVRFVSK